MGWRGQQGVDGVRIERKDEYEERGNRVEGGGRGRWDSMSPKKKWVCWIGGRDVRDEEF